MAPNCAGSCSLHNHMHTVKVPLSFKNVLDDAVISYYIKSQPLSTHLFKSLCAEMGSTHKELQQTTAVRWMSWEKSACVIMWFAT